MTVVVKHIEKGAVSGGERTESRAADGYEQSITLQ